MSRCEPGDVEDFELQLCDTQPSCVGGACSEFVFSGRLDNLCSSWQARSCFVVFILLTSLILFICSRLRR